MGFYIDQNGGYYEGDKAHWQDQDVPQRPSANHTWIGSAWVPAPPTLEQSIATIKAAVQQYLDTEARARRYNDITSAVSYDGDPDPTFAAEGSAFKAWRSAVWCHCIGVLEAVNAGARAVPTAADLIAELPPFAL